MTLPIIMAVRVKFSERQEYNNDNYTMLKQKNDHALKQKLGNTVWKKLLWTKL